MRPCGKYQQVPLTKYQVQFTWGRRGEKRWWLHHIIYITTNERKKKKREIKLLTLTTKLFKIMEMEKFYVAPEVEILEVAVEKGFEGSMVTPPDVTDDEI